MSAERLVVPITRVGSVEVPLPRYQTLGAAGVDLHAAIDNPIVLLPLERTVVQTGIVVAIPPGWEGQIRPRSGLALKQGLTVLNAPGTIDSDYRGEIGVILINLSDTERMITPLERIAQLVFARHGRAEFQLGTSLDETERGDGGFGSTGAT